MSEDSLIVWSAVNSIFSVHSDDVQDTAVS